MEMIPCVLLTFCKQISLYVTSILGVLIWFNSHQEVDPLNLVTVLLASGGYYIQDGGQEHLAQPMDHKDSRSWLAIEHISQKWEQAF